MPHVCLFWARKLFFKQTGESLYRERLLHLYRCSSFLLSGPRRQAEELLSAEAPRGMAGSGFRRPLLAALRTDGGELAERTCDSLPVTSMLGSSVLDTSFSQTAKCIPSPPMTDLIKMRILWFWKCGAGPESLHCFTGSRVIRKLPSLRATREVVARNFQKPRGPSAPFLGFLKVKSHFP